ncbi:hypothetical protein C5S35_14060 [Candidatus Methanophagaceae archaeon]|nr:hypothetical protein C5S35_14060 [Methanophagales archaeon]
MADFLGRITLRDLFVVLNVKPPQVFVDLYLFSKPQDHTDFHEKTIIGTGF